MRRADRRTSSDDNAIHNPHSRQPEPAPAKDVQALLATVRAQRDEAKQKAKEQEQLVEQNRQLLLEEQERLQSTLVLYRETQEQASSYLVLYNEEKARSGELLVKYNEARTEAQRYLALYQETQDELKVERRSKAGIKGWETRRKRENERLKEEIGEMAVLLRESLAKKDQAVQSLEEVAARMDRIQNLVDSVDGEAMNNPVGLVQKLQRIWSAIREILAE